MDRITEGLLKSNDEFYIEYKPGINVFTLRMENQKNWRLKRGSLARAKKFFDKSVLFAPEKINDKHIKRLKKSQY